MSESLYKMISRVVPRLSTECSWPHTVVILENVAKSHMEISISLNE